MVDFGLMVDSINRRIFFLEPCAWLVGLSVFMYQLSPLLLGPATTLAHDNYYWGLPIFHFFAKALGQGYLPEWNPLSHGGEPFFPALLQIRLLDPITLLGTYLLQHSFLSNSALLFNLLRITQLLVTVLGIYLLVRRWTASPWVRVSTIPILLFSSFSLACLRQDGVLNQMLWVPYLALCLDTLLFPRLKNISSWRPWLGLGLCAGLNWQSYFFIGTWLFLGISFLALLLLYPIEAKEFFARIRRERTQALTALVICLAMLGPNLSLLDIEKDLVLTARLDDGNREQRSNFRFEEEGDPSLLQERSSAERYAATIRGGNYLNPWNLLQSVAPQSNPHYYRNLEGPFPSAWGQPSEGFLYIGIVPWFIALLGLFFTQEKRRWIWFSVGLGFFMLSMGPHIGLHQLLFYLLPPLQYLRQLHCLVGFVILSLLYFYVQGANWLEKRLEQIA